MDVLKYSGIPKSSILIGFSIINHPFWGTPIFGNIQMNHWQGSYLFKQPAEQKGISKLDDTSQPLTWRFLRDTRLQFCYYTYWSMVFLGSLSSNQKRKSIKSWMGPYQRTPFSKLLELLDTQVFSGSVRSWVRPLEISWRKTSYSQGGLLVVIMGI